MTIEAAALQAFKSELQKVHQDYEETNETLAEVLNVQKSFKDIQSRVQLVEKDCDDLNILFAAQKMNGGGGSRVTGNLLSSSKIVQELQEHSAYSLLAENGKGSAATKIHLPLASVLGNEGRVGSGMTTTPVIPEYSGMHTSPTPALSLLDVLHTRPTESSAVQHVRFNITNGGAATQEKEGDEKAELEMGGALVSANIETIAATLPASRQVLSDNAGLQSLIGTILNKNVRSKLEHRILYGDGANNHILGLMSIGTAYTPSATNTVDKIGECVTAMQDEGYNPSIIAMRAMQWFKDVASLKDNNGQYLIGNPANPAQPTLWNGNVVKPASLQANTILVIDPAYVTVLDRQTVQILLSESHKDYFTRNIIQILCELRAGLEVTDAKAIRIITLDE